MAIETFKLIKKIIQFSGNTKTKHKEILYYEQNCTHIYVLKDFC